MSIGESFFHFIIGFGEFCYRLFVKLGNSVSRFNVNWRDYYNVNVVGTPFSTVISEFFDLGEMADLSAMYMLPNFFSTIFAYNGNDFFNSGFGSNGFIFIVGLFVPAAWFIIIFKVLKRTIL